jgi:parvulin-like peptidyl-prolyl isomerase
MDMKTLRLALPLVLALTIVAAGCGGGSGSVPADAVAVVDGEPVTRSTLTDLIARAKKSYTSQNRDFPKAGTQEYQALQTQAVAFLVQRVEYEKEAAILGVAVTDKQVDARIAEVRKKYFKGDQKALEKQLAAQGYTPQSFRVDIQAQLLSEGIFKEVTADVKVADAELRKYYDDNKAAYVVAESRDVRHILVKTKAQADKILAQLEEGGDFAVLAKKNSQDPGSKNNGGKLTIGRGQTVAEFDKVAFELKTNQLSEPIKTTFGFHIIQALGPVKKGSTTPFEKVKAQIKSQLEQQQKNDAITKWADEIAKKYKSKITYATGFSPPKEATATSAADKEK